MTVLEFLATFAMTSIGALLQGSIGIGLTLVAGPALVAIDGDFAPGPLVVGGMVVNVRHVIVERRHADVAGLKRLFRGIPFGIGAGLVVLTLVDERALAITIGAAVIVAALARLGPFRPSRSPRALTIGGGAVAFTTTTFALAGPPFALLYDDRPGPVFRGTAGVFLLPLAGLITISLIATGHFGVDELKLTLVMLPGLVLGLTLARYARPRLDKTWFRHVVLIVSAAGGAAVILRNL